MRQQKKFIELTLFMTLCNIKVIAIKEKSEGFKRCKSFTLILFTESQIKRGNRGAFRLQRQSR